ncbi:DUF1080 domain-containing protein [Litoribacter alkaliphilus]|uniref:DUF1080 domain-containing protein n=1 Tax=Litoribacter ruber TaxID=702568 RepID=A0AAP2G1D3_9BACT|nr:DUF1080 domain-containing protein [Litoribacter alkaliphilus]MBS9524419.1 DUF1080 domain-containing protein [Litoribacter alkaliphilus]
MGCNPTQDGSIVESGWQELFNGEDLEGWTVKITGHEVSENHAETFRVEDGLLTVSYDGYDNFDGQFGHLFYDKPFSAYLLRVEYRFVDEQAPGGQEWAYRNSGVMLHGQSPESMGLNQDFPVSIEGQLLGGDGENERPTSNLCTPGTHVEVDGQLFTPHCLNSHSKTYHGDQWVTAEFLVLGDSLIEHRLENRVVLSYTKPQIGGGNVANHNAELFEEGQPLTEGYISLQSESHPVQFRRVSLYDLERYMDDQEGLKAKLEELL